MLEHRGHFKLSLGKPKKGTVHTMYNNSITIKNTDQGFSSQEPFSLFDNQESFFLESYSDEDFELCSLCRESFRVISLAKNLTGKFYCESCSERLVPCLHCSDLVEESDLVGSLCEYCDSHYETDIGEEGDCDE